MTHAKSCKLRAEYFGKTTGQPLLFIRMHRVPIIALLAASACYASGAQAQAVTPNLVSACSGGSLPPSVVTGIITPVVNGIVTPVQNAVNPLLGVLPVSPDLAIDAAGLLGNAAAGNPVTLQVLNRAG